MPEYNKKKGKWCIGSGKKEKCYKNKETAQRVWGYIKSKKK